MRQNGGMTGTDDILDLRVTNEQRDRVIDYLGVALADGRLDHGEWEQRVEQAMRAKTRRELNATLRGLATVPLVSSAVSTRPLPTHGSSVGAGIVGLSALFTGPFGPLVGVVISERGSWSRRQIAKQANFQIDMFGLVVITMIVIGVGNMDLNGVVGDAMWAWGIVWVLGTLIRAIKAFEGTDWDDPVIRCCPGSWTRGSAPTEGRSWAATDRCLRWPMRILGFRGHSSSWPQSYWRSALDQQSFPLSSPSIWLVPCEDVAP